MKHLILLTLPLLLALAPASMLRAQATVRLNGALTDAATGEAIRGASIEIENTFFGTISDNNGHFAISTSVPMPFWVVCKRAGYVSARQQISKAADLVNIKMKRQGEDKKEVVISAPEYKAKLAFIERFAQYTTFPERPDRAATDPFHIGIFGSNPFGEDLFIIESHKIGTRAIDVRFTDSLESLAGLDVLFVPALREGDTRLPEIARLAQQSGILFIADDKKMLASGAMLAFALADNNIRFFVNKDAVDKAGLVLAAPLLNMASEK